MNPSCGLNFRILMVVAEEQTLILYTNYHKFCQDMLR